MNVHVFVKQVDVVETMADVSAILVSDRCVMERQRLAGSRCKEADLYTNF